MPMKRKNKCLFTGDGNQPWLTANVKRQRRRNQLAKQSCKANRGD